MLFPFVLSFVQFNEQNVITSHTSTTINRVDTIERTADRAAARVAVLGKEFAKNHSHQLGGVVGGGVGVGVGGGVGVGVGGGGDQIAVLSAAVGSLRVTVDAHTRLFTECERAAAAAEAKGAAACR
jgi:hypothetical protein